MEEQVKEARGARRRGKQAAMVSSREKTLPSSEGGRAAARPDLAEEVRGPGQPDEDALGAREGVKAGSEVEEVRGGGHC